MSLENALKTVSRMFFAPVAVSSTVALLSSARTDQERLVDSVERNIHIERAVPKVRPIGRLR